ncbi:MAG: cytochrome C oxidase subunit IV family protein [Candidatus Hydrogenedentes bacterium]|nr:cytochrome C oxidase subunit IV family protein [Candidatus Hydrogenedentota bacterium]
MEHHLKEHIHEAPHIVTPKVYAMNLTVLGVLMALTVAVYYIHLGNNVLNLAAALIIACAKMTCIALIFMHVRWSSKLTWAFAGAGLFWFMIMLTYTFADYATRYDWHSPFITAPPFGG